MFVALSRIAVRDEASMMASVKAAFVDRPHRVDSAPGFVRLEVLQPLEQTDEIWLLLTQSTRSR